MCLGALGLGGVSGKYSQSHLGGIQVNPETGPPEDTRPDLQTGPEHDAANPSGF